MTPEEATIKTAIEARLATLREQFAEHDKAAKQLQQIAQTHAMTAVRLAGGIAELEALAGGIVPVGAPEQAIP